MNNALPVTAKILKTNLEDPLLVDDLVFMRSVTLARKTSTHLFLQKNSNDVMKAIKPIELPIPNEAFMRSRFTRENDVPGQELEVTHLRSGNTSRPFLETDAYVA
jgi:hypothetical protein